MNLPDSNDLALTIAARVSQARSEDEQTKILLDFFGELLAGIRAVMKAPSTGPVHDFLCRLAQGGAIVSSGALSLEQITAARNDNRMLVLDDGLGFVYLPDADKEAHMLVAMRTMLRAGLAAIGRDGHTFGSRPCSTCDAVSALAGQDFGCVAFAKRRQK